MDNLIIREMTPEDIEEMRKSIYHEDKNEVVLEMFTMLKATSAFHNILQKMNYKKHPNGDESVECFFKYRSGREEVLSVNVTTDSGIALISDVWKRLYEMV